MRVITLLFFFLLAFLVEASHHTLINEESGIQTDSTSYLRKKRRERTSEVFDDQYLQHSKERRDSRRNMGIKSEENVLSQMSRKHERKHRRNDQLENISHRMRKERFLPDTTNDKSLLHMRQETDAPIVTIKIKEKSIHSVNFTVAVSTPSKVWCLPFKRDMIVPSIERLKQAPSHFIIRSQALSFDNLHSSTFYVLTCYAESQRGIPMAENLLDSSVEFKTKLNTASFVIPAITVEKAKNEIYVRFLSKPTKPTICRLFLLNNNLIDSIAINRDHWNETHIFSKIDIHSNYKVICGLDDQANLQSSSFAYYTAPQYIEATPVSLVTTIMRALILIGLVGLAGFAGYYFISRRREDQGNEENEKQPEEEKLLQNPSTLPTLSSETTAILNSLQPTSWRCSICQYLNDETATSCIMCHSMRDEKPDSFQPAEVEETGNDDDFSDFDVQPTNSFAAQTVKPKEPPKIVRVNDTAESESDSTEEEPVVASAPVVTAPVVTASVVAPVPAPIPAPAPASSPAAPAVAPTVPPTQEKPKETVVKSTMKPLPMKLRSTPGVNNKNSIVIKKTSTSQSKGSTRMKAKPAVIKVKKENDLFSELGMNAEVKETKRISRIPVKVQEKPKELAVDLSDSSDSISNDAWGNDDDDLSLSN